MQNDTIARFYIYFFVIVGSRTASFHHSGSGQGMEGGGCDPFFSLATRHEGRTSAVVIVIDLTVQTLETLIHIYLPTRLHCLYRTGNFTNMTRRTTFRTPLQPLEYMKPAQNS